MHRAGFSIYSAFQQWRHSVVVDYVLAIITTLAAGLVAWMLSKALHLPNASLVFLLAVLVVAVRSSLGPALFCAVLSFLAYDWLFISPTFSLAVHHTSDILTLLFFLMMAMLTGNLAARQRQQLKTLQVLQSETAALLALSRRLGTLNERSAMLEAAQQHFSLWRDLEFCLIGRNEQNVLRVETGTPNALDDHEMRVAEQAWHGEPPNQSVFRPRGWWWLPLYDNSGTQALLGVRARNGSDIPSERRQLLITLVQPLTQALTRARLASELANSRLQTETEQLRSTLLASVSHDLRTPLTVMHGAIDSLLTLGEQIPPHDRRELLESTRNEAERLDRYIQNLLDMTRLSHGDIELKRDWVEPADLVASALHRLKPVLMRLNVQTHVPDNGPLLFVHAALIEQALVNILENAARFSPPNGTLHIHLYHNPHELRLAVSDEGTGIPEAERAQIFDLFYTAARGDRGGKGTGLGLAICQGILSAHGGRITVHDGLAGRGVTLCLHLPLHRLPSHEAESA